ncbi:MAG: glycosyltransferase family 2 protein [Agriterribacter sp.]
MKYIVTLTSYGHRVEKTAPYAICSLLNQSVAPDKIILWLAHNTSIPTILSKLANIGLEIKFCDDLRSYKKLIPALREFPDDVLITADDDVFYPANWFERLKAAFLRQPSQIHAHRAYRIIFNAAGNVAPYRDWLLISGMTENSNIFPTGVGGILYPPNSLHAHCLDEASFLSIAPTGDDIWFWAMARLKGTKHSIVENGHVDVKSIDYTDCGLWQNNITKGWNDMQLKAILEKFPELFNNIQEVNSQSKKRINKTVYPEVSVVMPCYNCDKYVSKAISSILSQAFENFEFIIINDGSTDQSDVEVKKYLADQRIKYIVLKENKGNYPARNIGLDLARGKYIAVFDSDDIAEKGRLLLQYEYLEKYRNVGCVGSQGYIINSSGEIIGALDKPTDVNYLKVGLLKNNFTLHSSLMFRNSMLKKFSLRYNEDLTYSSDYDLVARASHHFKIITIPEKLIRYRRHEDQISLKKTAVQMTFADSVRLSQLNKFGIAFSDQEISLYQSLMKDQDLSKNELEQCVEILDRVLERNRRIRLYYNKYLYNFFQAILSIAYQKIK